MSRFSMKDAGETTLVLGMRITRDEGTQARSIDLVVYIHSSLERLHRESKPANTPENWIQAFNGIA